MTDDEDLIEAVLQGTGAASSDNDPEGADLVAADVAGALSAVEREALWDRLAEDEGLRAAWRAHRRTGSERAPEARGWHVMPWVAAAALLVGLCAWGLRAPTPPGPTLEVRLDRRLVALRRDHPGLFDAPPLLRPPSLIVSGVRGQLELLTPQAVLLDRRPTVRWRVVGMAPRSLQGRLRVEDEQAGTVRMDVAVGGVQWTWPASDPGLEPGRTYLLTLDVDGPLGPLRARGRVHVADAEVKARHERRLRVLQGPAARLDGLDRLLLAGWAVEIGALEEALRLLGDQPPRGPSDLRASWEALQGWLAAQLRVRPHASRESGIR